MLTLILADAELELVPDAVLEHSQVTREARGRGKRASRVILDASIHHEALKRVPEGHRRGRPDLVHFGLLLALDSALNKSDGLRVVVHTANDLRLSVRPDTRLMRHYPRFIGLMEQLFHTGSVPKENPLLTLEPDWTLERILKEHATGPIVAFDEQATAIAPVPYFEKKREETEDLTVVLGAFPHGDYRIEPAKWADEVVGLGGASLSMWSVEMEVLTAWENANKIFPRPADAPGSHEASEAATGSQAASDEDSD